MPYYNFECQKCMKEVEFFSSISNKTTPVCCSEEMVEIWKPVHYKPFPSFTTSHLTGKPMEITSLSQIRKLEKERESSKLCWEPGSYNTKYGEL